jgi:predicted branched-subunit amino acid permease
MNRCLLNKKDLLCGFKKGIPIALGYIPVSFTFGLMAVGGGLSPWMAVFISLSNVTSAGQFAGTNLIIAGSGYIEIALTTFIINIRYMLMSLSLSQKVDAKMTLIQRLIIGFGITDETFSVASTETEKLSYSYMAGLIAGPILGWTLGTALGAFISSALPESISNAMGIALYSMFIAIIVPPSKKSKSVFMIVIISVGINLMLKYINFFNFISNGFRVIIATVLGAGIGAALWPIEEKMKVNEGECYDKYND